ncbi:MAG TPA: DEAD/DEAH box helicase [Thermoanaerobaculia bacterium]|nr:DEAD/DEAH box helicase [Thermoanaerobaculia bacterium]
MTSNDLLDLLHDLIAWPAGVFWPAVAWTLDRLQRLGSFTGGLAALALVASSAGLAFLWQRRLVQSIEASPATPLGFSRFLKLELLYSLLGLPLWLIHLPRRLLHVLIAGLRKWGRKVHRRPAVEAEAPAGPPPPPPPPLLVASLGPGFLLAGLGTAVIYAAARLAEPLLARGLGLSPGLSAWQYLFLGLRPELAWYLPLSRFPYLGGLLVLLLWLVIWSLAGIAVRLAFQHHLGRNLAEDRGVGEVLPFWRRWSGFPFLATTASSFREWASWLAAAAFPLLVWAWLSLGGNPYRLLPSELAVAVVLWTSWSLHVVLRGKERLAQAPAEELPDSPAAGAGWPEVLDFLANRWGVAAPEPEEVRPVEPLGRSEADPRTAGVLSPLAVELLPPPQHLTPMQRSVLTRLALQGYVHVDPPVTFEELTLGETLEALDDRSGQRSRNLIVLAPEGSGKSALALLAAANHALVHTRGTLIVVRSEAAAETLTERFRHAIEPSTLRWNVRVRRPGSGLMVDLAQGILPDVVVCSLLDLVTTVLDRADTFAPFLSHLGLVIVDDVESFAGPVEVHAQLAFRRLTLRLRELTGARTLGEKSAPQVLMLGVETMHRMPEWVRSLCGVDAVVRNFSRSLRETAEREKPELTATGIALARQEPVQAAPGLAAAGPEQRCYRLQAFQGTGGRSTLADLVQACEQLAVPWHYRLCGDGRRNLGRGPLLLREEPVSYKESPEEACVILLEGNWSEVRRERERLRRAGARFRRSQSQAPAASEPVAFVTAVEPGLDEAFDGLAELPDLSSRLASLPWPFVRPPTGLTVEPHLSADLAQHWLEVEDVLRVFGGMCVPRLRQLASQRLLLSERRTDVDERSNEYVGHVFVRALAAAVRSEEGGDADLLPSKVSQVELAVPHTVTVRDRTRLATLGRTAAETAHVHFYPGRIFQDARGVFIVVARAGEEGSAPDRPPAGDVLVEPLLTDEVSSPRRLFLLTPLPAQAGAPEMAQAAGGSFPAPDRVLLGRDPFGVALEPVSVRMRPIATYRLDPVRWEVRQRSLLESAVRERYEKLAFETVALAIFPNPGGEPDSEEGVGEPLLTFEAARLLTAVLRALLPVMYRGAREGLQVALRLEQPEVASPEQALHSREGVYLFDADPGGNGMARAIYRDGLELLLRLCRRVLERAPSLDLLRTLFDEWGDETEVLAQSRGETASAADWQRAQGQALAWLNSRLRSEDELSRRVSPS